MSRPEMVVAGWVFVGVAVFLQLAYLVLRNWKPGVHREQRPGPLRRALFRLLVADLSEPPETLEVSGETLLDSD